MVLKSVATLMAGLCLALADSSISSNLPILYRVDQPNSNVVVFRGANVALAKAHGLIPSYSKTDDSDGDDKDNAGEGDDDGHGSSGNGYGNGYGSGYGNGYGNNGYNGNRYSNNGGYKPEPPKYTTTTTTTTTTTPYTTTTQYTTTTTYKPPKIVYKPAQPTYKPRPTYPQPKPYTPKYNVHEYAPIEANYDWEYAVKEHYNDFGHKESRHGYAATGVYYVALPDGRFQTVRYTADKHGFHPEVVYDGSASYPEEKPSYGKPSYSSA